MKKAYSIPILLTLLMAVAGHAATISWAVTTLPDPVSEPDPGLGAGYSISAAALIYTTSGYPVYENSVLTTGTQIGSDVTQIYPWGIGEQLSEDTETRTQGAYYVILFASNGIQTFYAPSTTGLVWNDTDSISDNPMTPPTVTYDPSSFQGWQPVPEPGTAGLLFAGIATALLRRRRRPA